MLYLFHMDGTLRRPRLPLPGPLTERDQRILPGRAERLQALHSSGSHLGAASNQGWSQWGSCLLDAANASWKKRTANLEGSFDGFGFAHTIPRPCARNIGVSVGAASPPPVCSTKKCKRFR
jgi:hypothetical protein